MLNQTKQKYPQGQLSDMNWDFKGYDTQYMTHGIHKYPARMIPQIARSLIMNFSKEGDVVFDPFSGSGTVITEAYANKRKAIGNDLNPLAILISKVRTTPISSKRLHTILDKINEAKDKISRPKTIQIETINQINNIDYWFKKYVLNDVAYLEKIIALQGLNKKESNFLKICFSATVRQVSNLRLGEYKVYRIPSEKLENHNPNVFGTFNTITEKYINKIDEFYEFCKENNLQKKVSITKDDTRNLQNKIYRDNSVDLIVTSPPYGDSRTTVAYGQFSRYSLAWLNFPKDDIYNLDKILLGGQKTELVKDLHSETLDKTLQKIDDYDPKRALDTVWFMNDLYRSLKEMARVLRSGGTACIVIGNRTVRTINVPTNKIIVEMIENAPKEYRLKHLMTIGRNISSKNNPLASKFKMKDGQIKWIKTMSTENIVIFKKI